MPDDGPLTREQADVVFTYLEVLERRVARDLELCGEKQP